MTMPAATTLKREKDKLYLTDAENNFNTNRRWNHWGVSVTTSAAGRVGLQPHFSKQFERGIV